MNLLIDLVVTIVVIILLSGVAIYSRKSIVRLTAFIVFLTIVSNIVVVPNYGFAGMNVAQITFAFIPLMTDVISERWNRGVALKVVKINAIINILLMVVLNLTLLVTPLEGFEWAQEAQQTLFLVFIPMTIAGITAYSISNTLDVYLYDVMAAKTKNVYLRSLGSTTISQAVDTIVLITLASLISTIVMGFNMYEGVMIGNILVTYFSKMFVVLFGAKLVQGLARGKNQESIEINF